MYFCIGRTCVRTEYQSIVSILGCNVTCFDKTNCCIYNGYIMKTVLNVKTDKDVKEKAQALAKHLGIPLSTVVNIQLKSFIESGELRITREPELRSEVKAELKKAMKDAKAGIGLSPAFDTAADMAKWLNSKVS